MSQDQTCGSAAQQILGPQRSMTLHIFPLLDVFSLHANSQRLSLIERGTIFGNKTLSRLCFAVVFIDLTKVSAASDLPSTDMEELPQGHTLHIDTSPARHLGEILQLSLPADHADLVSVYDATLRRCSAAGCTNQASYLEELISALRKLLRDVNITSDVSNQCYCLLVSCYHTRRIRK